MPDRFSSNSRTIVITGARRGIGFATALELARRGHRLILAARQACDLAPLESRFRQMMPATESSFYALDLASFRSIRQFADEMRSRVHPIDVVLHNAGLVIPSDERRLTEDGIEENLAIAAVGPMLLSQELKPALARPSRIVGVNSALHKPGTFGDEVAFRFDDPNLAKAYTGNRAYKNAKLAQLWFLFEWERRFGREGLHADAISPGFVPSTAAKSARGFQRFLLRFVWPLFPFTTSLDQAAGHIADLCEEYPDRAGARYFEGDRLSDASADALSDEQAIAFWEIAESWIRAGHGDG